MDPFDTAVDYSHTEIFESDVGQAFADAVLVATISGSAYQRSGFGTEVTRLIWIRHVDNSRNRGGTLSRQVTTQVISLPDNIQQLVEDVIENNPAFDDLQNQVMAAEDAALTSGLAADCGCGLGNHSGLGRRSTGVGIGGLRRVSVHQRSVGIKNPGRGR